MPVLARVDESDGLLSAYVVSLCATREGGGLFEMGCLLATTPGTGSPPCSTPAPPLSTPRQPARYPAPTHPSPPACPHPAPSPHVPSPCVCQPQSPPCALAPQNARTFHSFAAPATPSPKGICPFAHAWVDSATETFTAHNYAECSNRGACQDGACECYDGFEGPACQRTTCGGKSESSDDCQGHGTCVFVEELGDGSYGRWDRGKMRACKCDPRYTGLDCAARMVRGRTACCLHLV